MERAIVLGMKALGAAALLLLLGGSSSLYDLAGGTERGPQVFGGLRTWPEDVDAVLRRPTDCGIQSVLHYWLIGLIDVPCSLAGDLLLLPVTLPFEIFRN
jgi:hypothetical protein